MPLPHRGPDGAAVHGRVADRLALLARLSAELDVADLGDEYLAPLLGSWNALHDEAERWRAAARTAEDVTGRLTAPLGGLDAAWQGADADSFIAYMRRIGLAGHDLSDAMRATAEVLDRTADALRRIATDLAELLAETAEDAAAALDAPAGGPQAVRDHLDEQRGPVAGLHGAACDVLDSFARFCRRIGDGGSSADGAGPHHGMPPAGWEPSSIPDPTSTVDAGVPATAAAAADDVGVVPSSEHLHSRLAGGAPGGQAIAATGPEPPAAPADPPPEGGRGGMGMMPMMGGAGGKGGDTEHKSKLRITSDPKDVFGEPEKTAPPVIGEPPRRRGTE